MLLADLGADVVRIDRVGGTLPPGIDSTGDATLRGRRVIEADLKDQDAVALVLDLVARADVLVEGFRPGVAERLGLGPHECRIRNPRLIYARMTGWGQSGVWAEQAGHDINYLAITGVLDNIGPADGPPLPPLNLVGDYGGGSMFVTLGVVAALWERERSGSGQIIDAAMVEGVSVLAQLMWSQHARSAWSAGRGANVIDGSAPFYTTYACSDGGHVAVGAAEPQFFASLLAGLGLDPQGLPDQWDRESWPKMRRVLAEAFGQRSREAWAAHFEGTDACVTPVLTYDEAQRHPHMTDRGTIVDSPGAQQARPAPRFSRTQGPVPAAPVPAAFGAVLKHWS